MLLLAHWLTAAIFLLYEKGIEILVKQRNREQQVMPRKAISALGVNCIFEGPCTIVSAEYTLTLVQHSGHACTS